MKKLFITIATLLLLVPVMANETNTDRSKKNSENTETLEKSEKSEKSETKKPKKAKKKKEVKYNEKGEIIKTGLNYGPLPVVAFDADRGFQYGALLNLYQFGDGSTYPNPKSTWYFEASAYTKGSYKFVINYDNNDLIPNTRMSVCTGYYNDRALDFYGFNGYQTNYILSEDDFCDMNDKMTKKIAKGKFPKGFYRHSRQIVRAKVDFTGKIGRNFFWEAGYGFNWTQTKEFKPKGYTVKDGSLYDIFRKTGIISDSEANGGFTSALRAGFMYDSRNVENNPTKGIWADIHFVAAPKWLGTTHDHYRFTATWRHYVPLGTDKVVMAYRIAYQGYFGDAPWYVLPFYGNMGPKEDNDGIGGYRTTRGLMLNRMQGLHSGFYNLEFRWRFIDFKLWNQNISFALSAFHDAAHIFVPYDLTNRNHDALADSYAAAVAAGDTDARDYNALYDKYVNTSKKDGMHMTAGAGLRFIMNSNFIVAFEYAMPFDKRDGSGAFYINTGFVF